MILWGYLLFKSHLKGSVFYFFIFIYFFINLYIYIYIYKYKISCFLKVFFNKIFVNIERGCYNLP